MSGSKPLAERPEGGPLLARLGKGDVLIVAKLDRAFRNAADALATAERLKARKVDLIVADMGSEPVTQNGVSRMFLNSGFFEEPRYTAVRSGSMIRTM